MSTLRRRNIAESAPPPRKAQIHNDATQNSILSGRVAPKGVLIFSSLALSAFIWLYTHMPTASANPYALCSRSASRIYTADDSNSYFVSHLSGQIHSIVPDDVSARWYAGNPSGSTLHIRYIDDQSIVVPGLSDSHAHILEYGATKQLSLEAARSINETIALIREYIMEHPDVYHNTSRFVEGWGWDHTSWPVEEWPTADALEEDPVVHGRPVVLQSKDGHALWVSKMVLQLSGPFPQEVEGGVIFRDALGIPTGVLLDKAQHLPAKDALSFGLTSVHDAGFQPVSLELFERLATEGSLPIRIYGMRYFDDLGPYWGNSLETYYQCGELAA
ncbi:amidohydrolase family-domain-containing protein [Chiua virens]|nr:amidohydrolase family-domain-containing protein [Chiua virens]